LEHGEIGLDVMFNLIVQKAMTEINEVGPGGIVGRPHNLTNIKRRRLGLDGIIKCVDEVFSGMVGSNSYE
jgi:hypothetical protein